MLSVHSTSQVYLHWRLKFLQKIHDQQQQVGQESLSACFLTQEKLEMFSSKKVIK